MKAIKSIDWLLSECLSFILYKILLYYFDALTCKQDAVADQDGVNFHCLLSTLFLASLHQCRRYVYVHNVL